MNELYANLSREQTLGRALHYAIGNFREQWPRVLPNSIELKWLALDQHLCKEPDWSATVVANEQRLTRELGQEIERLNCQFPDVVPQAVGQAYAPLRKYYWDAVETGQLS